MLKGKYVYLRMLESEDWELTYKWHNDVDIQRMTCGPIRVVSKDIEKAWVNKVVTNNQKDLYLAICDIASDKMIGYISVNNINHLYRSCTIGGIVIGDKDFHDGFAYIEPTIILLEYIFDQLNMHRVCGSCLKEHIMSQSKMLAFGFEKEGCQRDAVLKNGKYYDVFMFALMQSTYRKMVENGEYKLHSIIKRMVKLSKSTNK